MTVFHIFITHLFCAIIHITSGVNIRSLQPPTKDWAFNPDFKFGAATSAYQIEGAYLEDGKGLNIWDIFTNSHEGLIADNSTGNVACDSYHNWQEDIQMVKNVGLNVYRFSISWTRLLPNGFANQVNPAGVDYYNNIINTLLENGIEPLVTLFHFDFPYMFDQLGVVNNPNIITYFSDFARIAFDLFGDRVKTWITFNEPKVVCVDFNVYLGPSYPVYPNGVVEYDCTRNILLAHAEAYRIYEKYFKLKQGGRVGITLNFEWSIPATRSEQDEEAAETRRQFEFGLYANPIINFDYPEIVRLRVANRSKLEGFPRSRLHEFTLAEKLKISGTYDFLGLNHYTSWLVNATPDAPIGVPGFDNDMGTYRFQDPNWEGSGTSTNKVVPWGLTEALVWIKKTYRNTEILITECGYPDQTGTLEDDPRIDYLQKYFNATLKAKIEDKVDVTLFTIWSIMDNFEWVAGYTIKYGLYNVDFNDPNRTRTPKKSAQYVQNVIQTRQP